MSSETSLDMARAADFDIGLSHIPESEPVETQAGAESSQESASPFSGWEDKPYSDADFALFHEITGYRLATRMGIWVVVNDDGNRAQVTDRLFTALSQEAFRLADLKRKSARFVDGDLMIDDLIATLDALRRAASQVGTRGLNAVARLEARLHEMRDLPVIAPFEIQAELTAL